MTPITKKHADLIKAHILATRYNVVLQDIIDEKDKIIEAQKELILEFIERDTYSSM